MPTQSRNTLLLATDQQNSVLGAVGETGIDAIPYTAYGHSSLDASRSQLRFNGELREFMTGYYPLGKGFRMYSSILMRFISPDSQLFSPFGKGGFNSYAYCGGDPKNRIDPSGHSLLGPIVKYLNARVIKFGLRSGLSENTINSLEQTKTALGGAKSIKQVARHMNISPHEYLTRSMPEMQPISLTRDPHPTFILGLTKKNQQHFLEATQNEILMLEGRRLVQQDLVDGLAARIGRDALELLRSTESAIARKRNLLNYFPPPYEPPPSYAQAMHQIRNSPN